jgi:hypothetical protein
LLLKKCGIYATRTKSNAFLIISKECPSKTQHFEQNGIGGKVTTKFIFCCCFPKKINKKKRFFSPCTIGISFHLLLYPKLAQV